MRATSGPSLRSTDPESGAVRADRLEVKPDEFVATIAGRPLDLTVRELQLLTALVRRGGRIVSRQELYTAVWQRPWRPNERSVDVYGFGYRLSPSLSQLFHTDATAR